MFNNIRLYNIVVSSKVHSPMFGSFLNSKALERLLVSDVFKCSYFNSHGFRKTGTNTSILIKESPFHYPVAKSLLSKSGKIMVLNYSVFDYSNSKELKLYTDLIYISDLFFKQTTHHLNSIFTGYGSSITLSFEYKPSLHLLG